MQAWVRLHLEFGDGEGVSLSLRQPVQTSPQFSHVQAAVCLISGASRVNFLSQGLEKKISKSFLHTIFLMLPAAGTGKSQQFSLEMFHSFR